MPLLEKLNEMKYTLINPVLASAILFSWFFFYREEQKRAGLEENHREIKNFHAGITFIFRFFILSSSS